MKLSSGVREAGGFIDPRPYRFIIHIAKVSDHHRYSWNYNFVLREGRDGDSHRFPWPDHLRPYPRVNI